MCHYNSLRSGHINVCVLKYRTMYLTISPNHVYSISHPIILVRTHAHLILIDGSGPFNFHIA